VDRHDAVRSATGEELGSTVASTLPFDKSRDMPMTIPRIDVAVRARVHNIRRIGVVVAIVLILTVAAAAWRENKNNAGPQYMTAAVTRGAVARTVTASGTVNPVTTVQVGTYVSGVIQQISCDYNTKVTKGQLCAKIDPRPYQTVVDQDAANLAAAQAQLEKDQTNLQYLQTTYTRNLDLGQRGIVPQDTVDMSKSAADQAKAQVELDRTTIQQREAELRAAQINLGYTNIISPVDGTVVSRNVTTGQTVAASFQTPTLFLIATDLTKMQVDANISESDIGGIAVGHRASFTVEAFPDHTFTGQVTQVRQAPQTVQNVVTYDVVVSVPNPDLLLKPGMTATIRVVIDERNDVLRVPDQALRYTPGGVMKSARSGEPPTTSPDRSRARAHVWVLRDGRTLEIAVTVGLDDDSYAEIAADDLQPGDQVIVSEKGRSQATNTPQTQAGPRLPRL